jgi:ATP-dependent exoDNAse (exonuclease V) beta subunit
MSIDYLFNLNKHERDSNILFDEGPHIYTINGDSSFTSVTTWVHQHFEKFDSDKIINNMMNSKNWKKSKYYGKTKREIKKEWNDTKNSAAGAGTKMHYDIECFYNKCYNENNSIEFKYFKDFHKDYKSLKPYRTEWMVYHEDYKLAGSIDMIFENDDGTLQIYDWKRSKEISKVNSWDKYSKHKTVDYLPDTNYWHYSLQLNTYKKILEDKYDKKITEMYLVVLHPNNNCYKRIKVADLQNEVSVLLKET